MSRKKKLEHDTIYTRKRVRGLLTTSPRQIQQIVDAPLIHVFLSLWVCGKGQWIQNSSLFYSGKVSRDDNELQRVAFAVGSC